MTRRLLPVAVLFALTSVGTAQDASRTPSSRNLTVHEWGTFTSIAGQDGAAVGWLPLEGQQDLPCFVDRYRFNIKGWLTGTVRMETPVLYFYSPETTKVRVTVRFHQGMVTEWYPQAEVAASGNAFNFSSSGFASTITWPAVTVSPLGATDFPVERAASHYYAARQTDAAPLVSGSEKEKFLFYRGIGGFQPPIAAVVGAHDTVTVTNPGGGVLGDLILFENRGGTMSYAVRHVDGSRTSFKALALDGEFVVPTAELERILIANGLYTKEAKAMVNTWRDSWFEEGTRLLYIAPRPAVDAILPLDIAPAPAEVARVFVGRVELVTTTTAEDVRQALRTGNVDTLRKFGRFLRPIADRVLETVPAADRARAESALRLAYSSAASPSVACQ